jgi:carboxymethylenebutenolidase
MRTERAVVETRDGPMAVLSASPDAEPRGAVVVVHEAFGLNAYIERVARQAAERGYAAVAPNFFHRTTAGPIPYGDHALVLPHIEELSDERLLTDIDATFAHLSGAGWRPESVGMVGFCIGGRTTFLAAVERSFGAAVGLYGGGIVTPAARFADRLPGLLPAAAGLRTPWLGLFGDLDHTIPVEDVEKLRAELASAPVETEIVRYGDAGHAFHCDERPGYVAAAATDAWARTLTWFERHLAPLRQ